MTKIIFPVLVGITFASSAFANSITSYVCEYNSTLNSTAIQLKTDGTLTSSATMTSDSAAPSGNYIITAGNITNTYSGNVDCTSKDFAVIDGSTTYND